MIRHAVTLLLLLPCLGLPLQAQEEERAVHHLDYKNPKLNVEALRDLPVLQGRRMKPLDSLARETIRNITLDTRFLKQDPVLLYLFLLFEPEQARFARIIHRPPPKTAKSMGYTFNAKEDSWTTWDEIHRNQAVQKRFRESFAKHPNKRNRIDNEVLGFFSRWNQLGMLAGLGRNRGPTQSGFPLPIIPPRTLTKGQEQFWKDPAYLQDLIQASENGDSKGARARSLQQALGWPLAVDKALLSDFEHLKAAYLSGKQAPFSKAALALKKDIRDLHPPLYPTQKRLDREVAFNQAGYFHKAFFIYAGASFLSLLLLLIAVLAKGPAMRLVKIGVPLLFMAWGFYLQVQGIWIRTALSERAIIGNFFDSMVFVAGAAVLLSLILELVYRRGWLVLVGSVMGWAILGVAISNPATLDSKIEPLQPVLINNSWIHIHVPTMMCSYAALGLTAMLGHLYLVKFLFRSPKSKDMKDILRFMGVTMPIGAVLLFVGMVLGGVWADASWGRFWGFDPKETWSLITWLTFMILIHGHFAGWLRDFGMALGTLVGGWSLVWTYWGANFFQRGLHSYAGSDPDRMIPAWLWIFAGVEILLILAATSVWWQRRQADTASRKRDPEPPGDPAVRVSN